MSLSLSPPEKEVPARCGLNPLGEFNKALPREGAS